MRLILGRKRPSVPSRREGSFCVFFSCSVFFAKHSLRAPRLPTTRWWIRWTRGCRSLCVRCRFRHPTHHWIPSPRPPNNQASHAHHPRPEKFPPPSPLPRGCSCLFPRPRTRRFRSGHRSGVVQRSPPGLCARQREPRARALPAATPCAGFGGARGDVACREPAESCWSSWCWNVRKASR